MSEKQMSVSFEEALNKTGFGKYNIMMMFLCGFLVTSMVFEGMSMSFLVPASACELNTTSAQQGLMAGLPLIGVITTSQMWGYLADTRGRRPILIISLLMGFSLAFISAFSPNWITFSIIKIISCSAVSGTYALAITLLSECTPEARRGSMIILTTALFMSANGLMAVSTIPILPLSFSYYIPVLNIHFNSWRLLSIIFSIPCLLGALATYSTWESPKYLVSAGREKEAIELLRKIYVINNGKENIHKFDVTSITLGEQQADKSTKGLWSSITTQTVPILKPPLLKYTILLSFLFVIVYLCSNPFYTWLPAVTDSFMRAVISGKSGVTFCELLRSPTNSTNVDQPCTLDPLAMTMVFSVSLLSALLNLVISALIPCCGRKKLLIGIQVFSGVSGVFINITTNVILSGALFIMFILTNISFGIITTFTVDIYPTYLRAMAVCLSLMVGRVSAIIGINIVKYMLVNNCEMAFYIFGTLTAVGILAAVFLPEKRETRTKKDET